MIIYRKEFKLYDKSVLGGVVLKPPFTASASLEGEARVVFVLKGKSKFYSPVGSFELSEGDVVIMKCENFINRWQVNGDDEDAEVMIMQLYPDVLNKVYDNRLPEVLKTAGKLTSQALMKVDSGLLVKEFFNGLRVCIEHDHVINEEFLKLKIQELILLLTAEDASGDVRQILGELFLSREYEFRDIIHTHIYEDLRLEDLAFFAGMSLSTFKRKFRSVFGDSPAQYIKSKRLSEAKRLLDITNRRVSEIAFDCGFNDISYFSKSFSAEYGYPPSEYRKSMV
ncbi:helix-turn-helix domain-containing protein [Aureibacter tunicatorum]|uniref:AraC-like DNA-binding protein n=1 Tax=Aureibacter tunicatorum TaxID=866807 RepID=A0AAE3XJV4_9BACT|nr:AraC family transcriptional regulator [Aureibacter tunicatorum]MDR6237742.1 AraC-like DNA-binding protein [Aureibacter tunicatorum]BDD02777.1 hypothetical protein AUTU_02600 [Aureibacter tunicatorum]